MRRVVWCSAPLIAALTWPSSHLLAQESTRAAAHDSLELDRRACDSAMTASVVDSERVVVRLTVRRPDGGPFPHPFPGLLLQELAIRFRPPQPLRVPVFGAGPIEMRSLRASGAGTASLRSPVVNGLYDFVIHRDGRASQREVVVPSHVEGLDSAVLDDVRQVSEEQSFPFPLNEVDEDSLLVQVRLTSTYAGRDASLDLLASYFPRLPVVDAARIGPEPTPDFPDEERKAGMYGDVRFQVVVDNSGRPDLATLEVLHAPTQGFALAALKTLASMRWTAARAGACVVPQVVHVNIRFEKTDTTKVR